MQKYIVNGGRKMDNNILTLLTSEDKDEIKKAIKDIIINQIEEDVKDCGNYLIDTDELNDMIQEAVEEAVEEAKDELKPVLKEFMFNEMKKKLGIED
jgi:hypothetical protein